MRFAAPIALGLMLAGCGGAADDAANSATGDSVSTSETPAATEAQPAPPPMTGPSAEELAVLDSRDCREVATAYLNAISRKGFAYASMFWTEGGIDSAALEARYGSYTTPTFTIADLTEEGAAGSLYCTVTGALGDASNPATPLREGTILLRRVNDVDGATPEQLRWTVRSEDYAEAGDRAGDGSPA